MSERMSEDMSESMSFFFINAALVITTVAVMKRAKVVMGRDLDRKDWSLT